MASVSQVPSSSSSSSKNLHDVLRSLAQRSLKRRRTEDNEEDEFSEELPLESTISSSTPQNDAHDQEDREDRFVHLASSVLYVDSSCRKNIKRKRSLDDTSSSKADTSKEKPKYPLIKTEKDAIHPKDIVDVHIESDVNRYKALLKAEDEHIQHIKDTPGRIRQEQVDLWRLYMHGLNKIKNLSDLSKAPDALMPGNHGEWIAW